MAALRPALSLHARVAQVKAARAGDGVSYGQRHTLPADTVLATLSIGYADGVRRAAGLRRAPVLVGGRRATMVGVVTMDQLLVDCGADATVAVGDEAVLIGAVGGDRVPVGGVGRAAGHHRLRGGDRPRSPTAPSLPLLNRPPGSARPARPARLARPPGIPTAE